jgi:hypothetical protein
MTGADSLLLLLSAKEQGSWQQFRSAVEELHVPDPADETDDLEATSDGEASFPIYRVLQSSLSALVHVSFREDNAWRVIPPALAVSHHEPSGVQAVLCGARTPAVVERLYRFADHGIELEDAELPDMPRKISVKANSYSLLKRAAETEGFYLQDAAPASLLLALRPVGDIKHWPRVAPPSNPGWSVSRFAIDTLSWRAQDDAGRPGQLSLLRYTKRFERTLYFLVRGTLAYRVEVQLGKYLLLHSYRRRVLRYDEENRTLSVPLTYRPPRLVERALVLCSGQLPRITPEPRLLCYEKVNKTVAALAYHSLGQGAA